jgi:DNA-binding NtrC family response regulator
MAALRRNRWPGNVRELMSAVRRAVVIGDGPLIDAAALIGLDDQSMAAPNGPQAKAPVSGTKPMAAPKPGSPQERATLIATLDQMGENITSTADALSVSRVTLYRMLRRHDIVLKRGLAQPPIARRPQRANG